MVGRPLDKPTTAIAKPMPGLIAPAVASAAGQTRRSIDLQRGQALMLGIVSACLSASAIWAIPKLNRLCGHELEIYLTIK